MSSKKMVFSILSLIILCALAFVVTPAPAEVLGKDFSTTITLVGGSSISSVGVYELNVARLIGENLVEDNNPINSYAILKVVFGKPVKDGAADTGTTTPNFDFDDVTVVAFNEVTGASVNLTLGQSTDTDRGNPVPVAGTTNEFYFGVGIDDDNFNVPANAGLVNTVVLVTIPAGVVTNNDPADVIKAGTGDDELGTNAKGSLQFEVVSNFVADVTPKAYFSDLPAIVLGPGIHDTFTFTVALSNKPKEFKKDHIEVSNATVSGDPIALPAEAESDRNQSFEPSGRVYPYLVTVAPKYESKDDIVIKIKPFENTSTPPLKSFLSVPYRVKVNSDANKKVGLSGTEKNLTNKAVIPNGGYLVVAKDKGASYITDPGNAEHGAADIARRDKANKQTYNMVAVDLGIDLEGFLIRGGTIDLVSPNAGLVISEIMWATDAGSRDRQWIEIANTSGAEIKLGDKTHKLVLYEASEVLPDMSVAANNIQDRVSTLYKGTNHWSIAGKGQSGRTVGKIVEERKAGSGDDENIAIDIEIVDTDRLVSMQRAMAADGTYADGTMASSWAQSLPPSQNFTDAAGGLFVGSPGIAPIAPVEVVAPTPEPDPVDVAMPEDIRITEIMVDTGDGRLPQWIELTNVSGAEKSLAGWSLMISNAAADTDVIGATVNITLSGTLGVGGGTDAGGTMGKSLLLVGGSARSSSNLAGSARVVDISSQVNQRGRYTFISTMAFMAALIPPQETGVLALGDTVGNLDAAEAWELPMSENGRSSLIRREMLDDGMATMGTAANSWVLASGTSLVSGPATWYGSDEDAGTPGYDAGGPLPVELSHFRPARDKATGAVVITWATQSELNNAGFFIKRSHQKDGQFKVINATMIPGAGTTSEKQFYTYTDTTAQPNVVYYYQIEDVSLDGQRQTLTRGIRLRGHIGAAGKLTTIWGELKEQE